MQLSALTTALARFVSELQRRKVIRVAAGYVVAAWIVLQVAVTLQTAMKLPDSFSTVILSLLVIGFPLTLVGSWFLEISPEGIKRTVASGDGVLLKPQTPDFILAGALVLVLVVALVQSVILQDVTTPAKPATVTAEVEKPKLDPPALGDKSIAVLPFANLSPDKENEYFADGLTEELLNLLAKFNDLKVISRTSSFAFKGKNTPLPSIAKALGVRHILEGSVRSEGDNLRVAAQLIDVTTDTHVWSQTYERKLKDIFVVQDQMARDIAGALSVEISLAAKEERDAPTRNLEAYRRYLQGLNEFRRRDGAPAASHVIELFKEATTLDPAFAEAHAMLAAAYLTKQPFEPEKARDFATLARASADTALKLKPIMGLAYAVVGVLDRGELNWISAYENMTKAVKLNPANSFVRYVLGTTLLRLGRIDDAAQAFAEVSRIDPLFEQASYWTMLTERAKGSNLAENLAREMAASARGTPALTAHWFLAQSAYDRGEGEEAVTHYLASLRDPADSERAATKAIVRALRSPEMKDAAIAAVKSEADADPSYEPLFGFGLLRADEAVLDVCFKYLAAGDRQRLIAIMGPGAWDPRGKAFRNNKRTKDLVRKLGFVAFWKKHGWPDRCRAKGEDDFECS